MRRWSMMLALLLGIVVVTLSGIAWLTRTTAQQLEAVRQVRIEKQQLQQQFELLRSEGMERMLEALDEDLETLQIRLVEILTFQPTPDGVAGVNYEQVVLPRPLAGEDYAPVHILRLHLELNLKHSEGLIAMMARIDRSIDTWPHETRACNLQRVSGQALVAQCVVDFYHWDKPLAGYGQDLQDTVRQVDSLA